MRKIMPFILASFLAIAACSSGSSTKTSSASSSTAGSSASSSAAAPVSLPGKTTDHGTGDATSGKLEVEMDDFYFNPTFIKVKPGSTVTLTLKNEGKAQHTFTSTALGVDQAVDPGKDVDITITVPASVPIEYHCQFHQGSGMQGALFDQPGATSTGGDDSQTQSTPSGGTYN